jgi:activating signal cointegrator complex subunit 1
MPPKPQLTHFLCIPLVTNYSRSQLQKSLSTFREDVTTSKTPELANGIPEKAIRPLGTLHLTLGVMSLTTPERVESALQCLQDLKLSEILKDLKPVRATDQVQKKPDKEKDLKTPELSITLRGLQSMHPPATTSILYTSPADPDLSLYRFCNHLRDHFTTADLLVEESRPLLLHATIVNTIYVPGIREKGGTGHGKGKGGKSKSKMVLNATGILEEYEDFIWCEGVRVTSVDICRMGAKVGETSGEEEYFVEGSVEMP